MFLFQFLKHRLPPTAPQPGAAHTSDLENWVGFFALSDVGFSGVSEKHGFSGWRKLSYKLIEVKIIGIQFIEIISRLFFRPFRLNLDLCSLLSRSRGRLFLLIVM